jgi:hypothetical protein
MCSSPEKLAVSTRGYPPLLEASKRGILTVNAPGIGALVKVERCAEPPPVRAFMPMHLQGA